MNTANEPITPWDSFESPAVEATPRTAATPAQTTREMMHDLKNILTPILGYVQLVLHDLPASDAQYRRIEKIQRAALSARALVLQTLREEVVPPSRTQDLGCQIRAFIEAIDGMVPENVRVELDVSPEACEVQADAADLQRVLLNLLANACQAMPHGGTLRIQTQRIPHTDTSATGFVPAKIVTKDMVRITVLDTGCGIAPEVIGRIFESGYTTKEGGNGVGLACVQRIVRNHQGWVDVDSIPNVGTAIHIYLPCVASHATASKAS